MTTVSDYDELTRVTSETDLVEEVKTTFAAFAETIAEMLNPGNERAGMFQALLVARDRAVESAYAAESDQGIIPLSRVEYKPVKPGEGRPASPGMSHPEEGHAVHIDLSSLKQEDHHMAQMIQLSEYRARRGAI